VGAQLDRSAQNSQASVDLPIYNGTTAEDNNIAIHSPALLQFHVAADDGKITVDLFPWPDNNALAGKDGLTITVVSPNGDARHRKQGDHKEQYKEFSHSSLLVRFRGKTAAKTCHDKGPTGR
jgi:hypothetical protein